MHVRFTTVIGMPLIEQSLEEEVGTIRNVLIQPDTGKIEGFFVRVPSFLSSQEAFVSVQDIQHWGRRVRIRNMDALSSLDDHVRLKELAEDGRTMISQRIVTESGRVVGTCKDVQFDTNSFYVEWLFPKRFLRWLRPIPVTSIVLVRKDAIVVRDAVTIPDAVRGPSVLETLDPLGTASVPGAMQRTETSSRP